KNTTANLTLQTVDLNQPTDEALEQLFQAEQSPELPWLVVRYPAASKIQENVWSGRLRAEVIRCLLDSPGRQEIAQRLLAGDAAVWVWLPSGDAAKDAAVADLLQAQLKKLQETLKLPTPTSTIEGQAAAPPSPPLRLTFSLVRVARTDPAEKMLVQMLLHTESDLADYTEPLVFPVFGRGRVLYALVGNGINADNLEEAARFVTGACSCT